MTTTHRRRPARALALTAALAGVAAASPSALAAPFNPPPGAEVRIERINGGNAMTVAAPKASVGLRVRIPAPADGADRAEIRVTRDGKQVSKRVYGLKLVDGKASLSEPIASSAVGTYRVAVRVSGRLVGKVVEFDALPRRISPGASGRSVRMVQQVLARRKYVVGKAGSFDGRTQRAIVALRKRLGMARTSTYDSTVAGRLARGEGAWKVRHPGHGRHVEADISMQLVALVGEGGKVERIYPTSTGAPATPTIKGSFKVYRKDPGTNALGMVHSAYFIRGYAIHGYKSVPTYNASHGCLRVPVPDALSIFRWIRFGTIVDVYA